MAENGNGKWAFARDLLARIRRPRRIMLGAYIAASGFVVLGIWHRDVDHGAYALFAIGIGVGISGLYDKIDQNTRVTVAVAAEAKQDRAKLAKAVGAPGAVDLTSTVPPVQREIENNVRATNGAPRA